MSAVTAATTGFETSLLPTGVLLGVLVSLRRRRVRVVVVSPPPSTSAAAPASRQACRGWPSQRSTPPPWGTRTHRRPTSALAGTLPGSTKLLLSPLKKY